MSSHLRDIQKLRESGRVNNLGFTQRLSQKQYPSKIQALEIEKLGLLDQKSGISYQKETYSNFLHSNELVPIVK